MRRTATGVPARLLRGLLARLAAVLLGLVLALLLAEAAATLAGIEIGLDPEAFYPAAAPGVEYTLRPGWKGTTFGHLVRVNALGFRGPELIEETPRRIVFLGDSFTFGFGIREEDSFPSRFGRAMLEKGVAIEVVNAGVPGYNSTQAVAVLAAHMDLLKPDCIVLALVPNDEFPPYLENKDGGLSPSESLAPWMPRLLRLWLRKTRTVQYVERRLAFLPSRSHANESDVVAIPKTFPRTDEATRRLRALADAGRAEALVMILPVFQGGTGPYPWPDVHAGFARAAGEAGLPLLDTLPALQGYLRGTKEIEDLWVDPFDHHPNARGHALFARALLDSGFCQ